MTQAYNLSQLANFINSSGKLSNSGLQNQSVTINTGSGLSGGGSVNLGGSLTLTNNGVTSISAGSGISVSGSSGAVTVTNNGVTSINGNSGAITMPQIVAWVNFNGTLTGTNAPRAGFNIASVTRVSQGIYTINFTTALPDTNYVLACTRAGNAGGSFVLSGNYPGSAPTTTSVQVELVFPGSGYGDDDHCFVTVIR